MLNELLTTEASYLSDLHVIMAEFYTPLRPLLPGELHMAIFSNLEQVSGRASTHSLGLPTRPTDTSECKLSAYLPPQLVGLHTKLAADLKPATECADDTTKEQVRTHFRTYLRAERAGLAGHHRRH